jgi:hypothetical protein
MTYPNAHLYLTLHWVNGGVPSETGQTGFRFDTVAPASQALVDACSGHVSAFWTAATNTIEPDYRLSYLRLASIAPNGQYVPGTVAYDHIYPGTIPGGGAAVTARFPLQVACASTLLTALQRGQAYKGRCYLPWIDSNLQSGYVWQPADVNNRTNGLAAMLSNLNDDLPGPLSIFSKGTKSNPGVGAKNVVTGVKTGTRPDVQRRRANQETEVYGLVGAVN